MRFGNFVVVKYNGKIVCGKVGDQGIYLTHMGDASPIPHSEVEPLFEIEVSRPFPEYFKVDDFRKFVISTLADADPVEQIARDLPWELTGLQADTIAAQA